jgi:hypothetical protein
MLNKKKKKRIKRGFRYIFNIKPQLKIFKKSNNLVSIDKQIDNYILKKNAFKNKSSFF